MRQMYEYAVGDLNASSPRFLHRTPASSGARSYAVVGDMGAENARCVPVLREWLARGAYDTLIQVGDLAYDLSAENSVRPIRCDQASCLAHVARRSATSS